MMEMGGGGGGTRAAYPQMEGKKVFCSKIALEVRRMAQKCALFADKMGQQLIFALHMCVMV